MPGKKAAKKKSAKKKARKGRALTKEERASWRRKLKAEAKHREGKELTLAETILLVPGYDPWRDAGDCYFDEEAASEAIAFFHECLTLIEGEWAGQPFKLEPWQQAVIALIFGMKRPDGFRRYKKALLFVPRKNGKSPLAAGIGLKFLVGDGEPGAQIYVGSGEKEQAALIYRWAAAMVGNEPELDRRLRCYRAFKSIEYDATSSYFRAISSDAKTKHGFNTHAAIIDELHVLPNGDLVTTLTSSMGTRRQPFTLFITTSDFERPGSICNETHAYATKVRDGLLTDPEFLPVIYEASVDDDWTDEKVWYACNPNLGVSIKLRDMQSECRLAQHSPRERNLFKRYRLNIRTQADVAWVPMEYWRKCGKRREIEDGDLEGWIRKLKLEGRECFAGLDLSSTRDLSAFVLVFPDVVCWRPRGREPETAHVVLPYFFAPQATAEDRETLEGVSYIAWAEDGWLELTPGNVVDYDRIRQVIGECGERFRIREINFDRWGAQQIATQLDGDGFEMVKFGQGYASMSEPSKELERLWLKRGIRHGGHPVLEYCAACVMVQEDPAGNIKPSKSKSTGRIDGIVALVMALGGAIVGGGDGESVYASRGILSL